VEFNTNEDLHTIMVYKRHEHNMRGDYSVITVDIDAVATINEGWCKLFAMVLLDDCLTREV
jgi:hypothetical protein